MDEHIHTKLLSLGLREDKGQAQKISVGKDKNIMILQNICLEWIRLDSFGHAIKYRLFVLNIK